MIISYCISLHQNLHNFQTIPELWVFFLGTCPWEQAFALLKPLLLFQARDGGTPCSALLIENHPTIQEGQLITLGPTKIDVENVWFPYIDLHSWCVSRSNRYIVYRVCASNPHPFTKHLAGPIPFNFDSPQASWPQVMNSSSTFHHTWPEGADLSWFGGTSKPSVAWLGEVFWFCVLHPEKWHEMHVPRLPFTAYAFSKLNFLEDWDGGRSWTWRAWNH